MNAIDTRTRDINLAIDQGHLLQAVPLARQLAEDFPQNAAAQYLYCETLKISGDFTSALKQAEIACSLDPGNFQYLYMCGFLYNYFHLPEYALGFLQRSVSIEPRAGLSQFELGRAYFEMRLAEKALPYFQAALKLQPDHELKDNIRYHMAQSLQTTNQTAEALPIFKRLAKESPKHSSHSLMSLVEIESSKPEAPIIKKMKGMIEEPERTDPERRMLWLGLGKAFLNAKDIPSAFDAWTQAAKYGRDTSNVKEDHETQFAKLTGFYTPDLFAQTKSFAHDSQIPVFVAGMPRSGTTLTEQIVSSHSQATGVGEVGRWRSLDEALRHDYAGEDYISLMQKNAANGELRRRAEEILDLFGLIAGGLKARVIEKLPHNFIFAGYQALLFPNAKFLHLRRHPADAFISTYQNNFSAFHSYGLNQEDYIKEWAFHERMMSYWKSIFGDRIVGSPGTELEFAL